MGQERLEDLMILAVEAEQTQQLDLNHIRELFWNMADRRRITRGCGSALTAVFVLPPQPESMRSSRRSCPIVVRNLFFHKLQDRETPLIGTGCGR